MAKIGKHAKVNGFPDYLSPTFGIAGSIPAVPKVRQNMERKKQSDKSQMIHSRIAS
jgi:L-serine deaminase